jgi:CheY-specific phosphatase CheX
MLNSPVRRQEHGESVTPAWPDATVLIEALTPRSQEIWNSMLGLALEPAHSSLPTTPGQQRWTGCIALSGDWRGAVTVSCMEPMAKLAAASMFGMDVSEAAAAEIQDAIGEVANMIGGQTKTVLGGTCALGLPVVIEGEAFEATVPHSHTVAQLHFLCEGHPVDVTIVGADARGAARSAAPALSEN